MTDSVMNETTHQADTIGEDLVDPATSPDKLVPVSEAIRYRKRAQAAEQQLEALHGELDTARTRLSEADQTIVGLERQQKVDALLTEADVIDLETARLLTEQAVSTMDEADVELAVKDLRRHKPYLFRRRQSRAASAMAPNIDSLDHNPTEQAAEKATLSGDRRDLLRYLRLRRQQ